jgi:hypothetical protein
MMKAVTTEALISALDSVTWYNGLAEIIVKWKDEGYLDNNGYSLCWNWDTFNSYDKSTRDQLEVIWMICVELFGNCGTSPRSGWIELENKDNFYQFVDDITKIYRESDEFGG